MRERVRAHPSTSRGGAEREREREGKRGRERIPGRLHAFSAEPDTGLDLANPEVVS